MKTAPSSSESGARKDALETAHERSSSEEASTSGRSFRTAAESSRLAFNERAPRGAKQHGSSNGKDSLFSDAQASLPRLALGRRNESRSLSSSGQLDRNAPLDLRRRGDEDESPLTMLKRKAAGRELSQGLTSLLNAPGPPTGASSQLSSLGAVWCWPFGGAGPEMSLSVPPPDPTILPPVSLADFQPYLKACGLIQQRYKAARAAAADAEARSPLSSHSSPHVKESDARLAPGEGLLEALRAVPSMFFEEGFTLARPDTWQEVVSTEDEGQRLARLEEYSGFLDVVESQLLKEIASRSDHFFEASSVVQDLRLALHRAYGQVTTLRRSVGLLKADMQKTAAAATRQRRRKANMLATMEVLKVVQEVAAAQQAVELLLPQGDYVGALDVVDSLHAMMASRATAGLHAFRRLPAQLRDISEAIDELLGSELLQVTRWQAVEEVVKAAVAGLPAADSAADSAGGVLEEQLLPLVLGLRRTGHLAGAIRALQIAASEDVKAGIRDVVEGCLAQTLPSRAPSAISDRLQDLQPQQFIGVLQSVTAVSLAAVRHVHEVRDAVSRVLKSAGDDNAAAAAVQSSFAEVVQAVSEAAHGRWIKLLASRSSAVTSLDLKELQQLLAASSAFAETMQAAGCRPVVSLRNVCQAQSKAYLESIHRAALATLATALEQETWSAAEVPRHSQRIVDQLVEGARMATNAPGPLPTEDVCASPKGSSEGAASMLAVDGTPFHAVRSELVLLQLLAKELRFLDVARSLAAEVTHRVVELVKVFNSRMCQLVLGAGAMQVAGLKSITAKHLALSCQCLGALIALQPALSGLLVSHLPPSRHALVAPELDLALKDLVLHRGEIHSKLVGIMRERLLAALRQLPAVSPMWASLPPEGDFPPSTFSQSLAKQLRVLSQVLSPMLLEDELHVIFGRVSSLYSKNLAEAFTRLESLGPSWDRQARADVNHLLATLAALPAGPLQEASLERLRRLVKERFPLNGGSRQQTEAGSAVEDSPNQSTRSMLVSRLSNTRLPFFKRDKIDRLEPEAAAMTQQARPPPPAAAAEPAAPDALQRTATEGSERLQARATVESLVSLAAEGERSPREPVSRLQSFGDDLTAFTDALPADREDGDIDAAAAASSELLQEGGSASGSAGETLGSEQEASKPQPVEHVGSEEVSFAMPASDAVLRTAEGSGEGSDEVPDASGESMPDSPASGESPQQHKAATAIQEMLQSMQAEDWENGSKH